MGCARDQSEGDELLKLPIIEVARDSTITSFEYLGAIEGIVNVEIRPQVEGILDSIYVDEGQYVEANQPLFKINAMPYQEQLKNAEALVAVEKARLRNAEIELERLHPLVVNEVISEVQLRQAESDYAVAKASLEQSQALAATSQINVGFTLIKAPVSGYIGRIPKRIGNLVAKGDSEPMTILSDIHEVFVYFSMSESNYLFYKKMREDTTVRRLNPNVRLILADGSEYGQIGRIDADAGQIDRSTGAITLRAKFSNPDALLRTGNTGKIVLEQIHPNVLLVPQSATSVIQDKTFVFVVQPDSTLRRREITIEGKSDKSYIIGEHALQEGDKIIVAGLNKVTDSTKIIPVPSRGSSMVPARATASLPDQQD